MNNTIKTEQSKNSIKIAEIKPYSEISESKFEICESENEIKNNNTIDDPNLNKNYFKNLKKL